jgi:predicted lipoprotein with Yx(FWY)xxD motif
MSAHRSLRLGGGLFAVLALVAACSGAASPSPAAPTAPPVSPSVAASPSSEASGSSEVSGSQAAGGAVQLATASGSAGTYLTGANGMTLYIFKKDTPNATTSACSGQCATNWPPLEVADASAVTAGTGVSGTIGTITRADDGKLQVTYNGLPLYYYAADKAAGDTTGQGVGNVWFIAEP